MCGIAAIYAYENSAPPVDREELLRIRDHMVTRGPDGFGDWYSGDNRVGLAHRRLSIIDLSDIAAQPMTNDDGSLIITYNGEIYNYNVLRERLKAKGCHFRSHSDTEVLLHLYAEKGPEMVHELRGMYAFAIWDAREECLLLLATLLVSSPSTILMMGIPFGWHPRSRHSWQAEGLIPPRTPPGMSDSFSGGTCRSRIPYIKRYECCRLGAASWLTGKASES